MKPQLLLIIAPLLLATAAGLRYEARSQPAHPEDTERRLAELIYAHPDSARLRVKLASVQMQKGTVEGRSTAIDQLKAAIRLDPDNPGFRLMLAEVYFEATFWKYGVDELGRILDHWPDYHLARWRRGKAYLDRAIEEWQLAWFRRAASELSLITPPNPIYPQASRDLALCWFDLGYPDSAIHILRGLEPDSMGVDGALMLGMAACRVGRMGESQRAFDKALAAMDGERRRHFLSMELIATREEQKDLAGSGHEDPQSAVERLWKRRDPNPASIVNERLVEHLARVAFADFHFSVRRLGRTGSQTARGEAYIRYGNPVSWHFDPFGTGVFADDTAMPDPSSIGAAGPNEAYSGQDVSSRYRSRPLRVAKARWIWQYRSFTLNFEDTFQNGDYDFPYEMDWSAYTYAYLEKRVPEIYEDHVKTRMRVVLDALNFIDRSGRQLLKIAYACDTRGLTVESPYQWPRGTFDVEISILDSLYNDIDRASFAADMSADSGALYQTRYPLIGTWIVEVPPGRALAAVALTSRSNRAAGYTTRSADVRAFGDSLELSDIELRFTPSGQPNPSHTYLRRGIAYAVFSVYNCEPDSAGVANLEISYSLSRREKARPAIVRLWNVLAGEDRPSTAGSVTALWSKYQTRSPGRRTDQVIGVDLAALALGDYDLDIRATDKTTGRTAGVSSRLQIDSEIAP